MTLEQLIIKRDKIEAELNKIEEKKKELQSKMKDVNSLITVQEAEKATKVMSLIEEKFGKLTDDNLEVFQKMLEENAEYMRTD